ncbi:glycosyltransferase family 4 protein [Roseovarius sp.]|jgi:glycosyltransferase involved in cell wall biosynthesis
MKIGYLLNTYPVPSSTFIRREIRALEGQGVTVMRYGVRRWADQLVDPLDREEQTKTRYLLSGQVSRLITGVLAEALTNPIGLARAIGTWGRLVRNAGGGVVRHAAYLLEAVSLRRQAKADGIEHIHAHFSTNAAAVALLCYRLGGPSYSFTAHGPDEFIDWGRSSLALKVAEARFVAAISNYCRVQLILAAGMAHWDKIHIVRCGLDLSEFPPSKAGFEASAPFVCVGRLCPQKAQVLIVEATARVVRSHPEVKVRLIGDGESRADVEAAITRHGLEGNIELLGWQANDVVRAELGRARALLLPSFAEGLPVVIMEALALGRPAISTYIAGIPELVDESCGWIIPAGSVDHISQVMADCLATPPQALADKGATGRARVQSAHDIDTNSRTLAACFAATKQSSGQPSEARTQ